MHSQRFFLFCKKQQKSERSHPFKTPLSGAWANTWARNVVKWPLAQHCGAFSCTRVFLVVQVWWCPLPPLKASVCPYLNPALLGRTEAPHLVSMTNRFWSMSAMQLREVGKLVAYLWKMQWLLRLVCEWLIGKVSPASSGRLSQENPRPL